MAACAVSSRDRYLTAFRHEEPDRVPLDLATSEGFRFPGEAWRRGPLERLEAQRRAGGDPCLDIWLPEPAFHPSVRVRHGSAGRDEQGYRLLCTEYDTPRGTLRQLVRESPDWCSAREHQLMHRGYYETPEYFSPENYARFCRPLLVRLGTAARQAGARFALQRSRGNTRQVALLKQLPIAWIEPGTNPAKVAAAAAAVARYGRYAPPEPSLEETELATSPASNTGNRTC